jgi:uncharacterized protein (DUF2147 family)
LITLGIIGVVAAMTIPSLIYKCQKIIWASQAKKEYALWTQVFKRILADNNTTSLSQTELWGKMEDNYWIRTADEPKTEQAFWTELGKYVKFSIATSREAVTFNYDDKKSNWEIMGHFPIYLLDGSSVVYYDIYKNPQRRTDDVCKTIKDDGGSMCNSIAWIVIDVNGKKGPSIAGRDLFFFYLSDEGVLYPYGGKDAEGKSGSVYWRNFYENPQNTDQLYRTGQLIEEGWKMNY